MYLTIAVLVHFLAVLPHLLEYCWAWGWPGARLAFPLAVVGGLLRFAVVFAAILWAIVRPRQPVSAVGLRILAVPLLLVGPGVVFSSFGDLPTSAGRGLAARIRTATPLDAMQGWAVECLNTRESRPMPEEVARTLPSGPEIEEDRDHMVLRWYDRGVLVGGSTFHPSNELFFLEEVRPGVYVFAVDN